MNKKQLSRKVQKIKENYTRMRTEFWPEVTDDMIWHLKPRELKVGFSQIPRCITLISIIMDELADVKISPTYLALWCHAFDEGFVIISDPKAMSFESGFTKGQRTENTWRARMKELVRLGFIKAAPGRSGEFNYILILNPYAVIKRNREEGKITDEASYNALLERASEIGADDDL
jgi:hypothetical protein